MTTQLNLVVRKCLPSTEMFVLAPLFRSKCRLIRLPPIISFTLGNQKRNIGHNHLSTLQRRYLSFGSIRIYVLSISFQICLAEDIRYRYGLHSKSYSVQLRNAASLICSVHRRLCFAWKMVQCHSREYLPFSHGTVDIDSQSWLRGWLKHLNTNWRD